MIGENWKLAHVGIPVTDLDASMTDYQTLGNASFKTPFTIDSSKMGEYLVYGKTPDPVVITRGVMGTVGPLPVELLQPVQGETVHKELLGQSGDGIGHIAYYVDDLEAEVAELETRGFPVILSITPALPPGEERKRSAVYIDTRGVFSNLIIELMQAQ